MKPTYAQIMAALVKANELPWVANAGITHQIEDLREICLAYADWNNDVLYPLLDAAGEPMRGHPLPKSAVARLSARQREVYQRKRAAEA